jgi:hypothetical protein
LALLHYYVPFSGSARGREGSEVGQCLPPTAYSYSLTTPQIEAGEGSEAGQCLQTGVGYSVKTVQIEGGEGSEASQCLQPVV